MLVLFLRKHGIIARRFSLSHLRRQSNLISSCCRRSPSEIGPSLDSQCANEFLIVLMFCSVICFSCIFRFAFFVRLLSITSHFQSDNPFIDDLPRSLSYSGGGYPTQFILFCAELQASFRFLFDAECSQTACWRNCRTCEHAANANCRRDRSTHCNIVAHQRSPMKRFTFTFTVCNVMNE